MTEDDARKHAQRMIDTWPSGPKAYVWRELFKTLDSDIAHSAYHALIRTAERVPTPGQYMAQYNALVPRPEVRVVRADPDGIGLGDYLELVAKRAGGGSTEAQAELERWERCLSLKPRTEEPV